MLKINLVTLLLLAPSFLGALEKYKDIKPDSLAPRLIKLAQTFDVSPHTIKTYSEYYVTPDIIEHLSKVKTQKDTESYIADVHPGQAILCTYFTSGEYSGEIWAYITHLASTHCDIPIPQQNFFILKGLYAGKNKS